MEYFAKVNKEKAILAFIIVFVGLCFILCFGEETRSQAKTESSLPTLSVDGPKTVYLHGDVPLTITITGQEAKKNLILIMAMPKGLALKFIDEPTDKFEGGNGLKWDLKCDMDEIRAGEQKKISVALKAMKVGPQHVKITLSSPSERARVEVAVPVGVMNLPEMSLTSKFTERMVGVGKEATYVIEPQNKGTVPVTNVRIHCTIPEQMEFASAAGPNEAIRFKYERGVISFDAVPTLPPGEKLIYKVVSKAIRAGMTQFESKLAYEAVRFPMTDFVPAGLPLMSTASIRIDSMTIHQESISPEQRVWEPGRWEKRNGRWHWLEGHWR